MKARIKIKADVPPSFRKRDITEVIVSQLTGAGVEPYRIVINGKLRTIIFGMVVSSSIVSVAAAHISYHRWAIKMRRETEVWIQAVKEDAEQIYKK